MVRVSRNRHQVRMFSAEGFGPKRGFPPSGKGRRNTGEQQRYSPFTKNARTERRSHRHRRRCGALPRSTDLRPHQQLWLRRPCAYLHLHQRCHRNDDRAHDGESSNSSTIGRRICLLRHLFDEQHRQKSDQDVARRPAARIRGSEKCRSVKPPKGLPKSSGRSVMPSG